MPILILEKDNEPGINANKDHHWNQFFKGFIFLNFEDKSEPIFGLIDMHSLKFDQI
jgi:hypothetical protein